MRVLDNNSRSAFEAGDIDGRFEYCEATFMTWPPWIARAPASTLSATSPSSTEPVFLLEADLVLDVAVKGIVNVIDGAIRQRVPELMVMSSSEVYHEPETVPTDETVALSIPDCLNPRYSYAAGKILHEVMAIHHGRHFKRITIIRQHNVYGSDMLNGIWKLRARRRSKVAQGHATNPIPFTMQGTGLQTRSFVYVDDFVDGVMIVLDRGEHLGVYHIGTLEEVTIEALARLVAEHYGRPIKIVPGPPAEGGTNRRCPDITKIMKLGYRPQYTLREALPDVVRWYDERITLPAAGQV